MIGGTELIRNRLCHPAVAVLGDVVDDLPAAGGVADMDRIVEIKVRSHRSQIVGVVVHVMTNGSLGGSPVAAAVVRDDPVAVVEEEQHLGVPVVGRQWPAMAEHDRLTGTPVLVEDLESFGGGDCTHLIYPSR